MGSIQSASNGGSRVLWALFLERFGFKKLFIVLVLINILTCGVMTVAAKSFIGYLIVELVIFSAEGGLIASYPVISAKIFGHKVLNFKLFLGWTHYVWRIVLWHRSG